MITEQVITHNSSLASVPLFVCPTCKGKLTMSTAESLYCKECKKTYPVIDGVYCFLTEKLTQNIYNQLWEVDERSSASSIENAKPSIIDFEKNVIGNFNFSGNVLEIGSGLGWASRLIKENYPGCQVFTSDISLHAIQKGKAIAKKTDVDYALTCRIEKLPFPDNFFDYIYGSAVLIYTDLSAAFAELRRVLKVGGYYIGIRECASSPLFTPFYSLYARKSDPYASLSNLYSYKKWVQAQKKAGFAFYQVTSCRDLETKASASTSWYNIAGNIPDLLLRNLFFTEIHMLMRK